MERVVLVVAVQVFVAFISFTPVFIAAQANTGYLTWSIDCGGDRNYTDDVTGIPWVTDEAFIQTGKNVRNVTVDPSDQPFVNKDQLSTLRYFDNSRRRNCYVLPVKARTTYLLRATFYLGNLVELMNLKGDVGFWMYFNTTYWKDVSFYADSNNNKLQFYEAIIYSPGAVLNICLLIYDDDYDENDDDTAAFISTLELREFTSGMYSKAAAGVSQYQDFYRRIIAGVPPVSDNDPLSYIRFPDDHYDRLWWAPRSVDVSPGVKNTNVSSSNVRTQNALPDVVMNDAWTRDDTDTLQYSDSSSGVLGPAAIYCYVMETNDSAFSGIQYSVNDILIDTFNSSSVPQEFINSITVLEPYLNMTFTPTHWSASPVILIAFEIYQLNSVDNSYTAIADVNRIANIKETFNLTDWSGDPCLPFSYDWLNCTSFDNLQEEVYYDDGSAFRKSYFLSGLEYRITGLSLVNTTNDAKEIIAKITDFTGLTELYLSNIGLSGSAMNFSQLTNLAVIGVSNNNLDGEVVEFVRSANISNLRELYMSGNQFSNFSSKQSSPLFETLTTLDLSSNHIQGDVMNFVTSVRANSMTNLYAANNSLGGQFNTNQLSVHFSNIQIAAFDDQNISGTLDLSGWNLHGNTTKLIINLKNNKIDEVYPAVDVLSKKIKEANDFLDSSGGNSDKGGILLDGNPWCKTTDNRFLVQRYLCRNDSNDFVDYKNVVLPDQASKKKLTASEIVGIVIGTSILIICCIIVFAIMLRKLRKKSRALAEIQGALTKQEVHPPLYSYSELRTATKNFAYDNKLGQGTYGAVYRGGLANGTQVAVKKLFKDSQVLAEFLNEAVLITGIKHRNLAQLRGCCIDQEQRILVYEYAENGNLAEALWVKLRNKQIVYISCYHHLCSGYLAPEYIMQGQLTEKADVFSCGVVFLEIVSGRKCIDQTIPPERVWLVRWADTLRKKGNVVDILDSSIQSDYDEVEVLRVIDIAFSCLDVEPFRRPTMSQVVTILQGNTTSFKSPLPSFSPFFGSTGTNLSRSSGARSLSLGSASYAHDSSDQLAFLLDQTSRSQDVELSSMSGKS